MNRPPVERLFHHGSDVRVGTFRCPIDHPEFATAGAIQGYTIVFPRTAVWIEHEGRPPFVADPSVVTIYNQGQPYLRRPLAIDGDRGEWFSVSRSLAFSIAEAIDPAFLACGDRPFPMAMLPITPALYLRQRELFLRIAAGGVDDLAIEENVIALIGAVLALAAPRLEHRPIRAEHRDAVEGVRALLAGNPAATVTIRQLSTAVGLSPFHLCRLFRRVTGSTIHATLVDLRVRASFEMLESEVDLSRVAHRLGFSSHSHFSLAFRRRVGQVPRQVRSTIAATRS